LKTYKTSSCQTFKWICCWERNTSDWTAVLGYCYAMLRELKAVIQHDLTQN